MGRLQIQQRKRTWWSRVDERGSDEALELDAEIGASVIVRSRNVRYENRATEAVDIKSLAADMGLSFSIVHETDASSALEVVNKRGIGKMRHNNTLELWMQNATRTKA